ncbi:MAG: type II toxin-antitoxin system prevent-host-death family antitoxin [Desulfohalobiaceae bacterium]|nr:type II toxin-antitoxin system prevent-host-death family antitoxin [Desulfohalobiaceae bacterium]
MEQTSVGIREAKIHLSRFLKVVKNGGEVIITEHGKPVGKIVPFQQSELNLSERLERLIDKGVIARKSGKGFLKCSEPLSVAEGVAQKYLKEDRENAG